MKIITDTSVIIKQLKQMLTTFTNWTTSSPKVTFVDLFLSSTGRAFLLYFSINVEIRTCSADGFAPFAGETKQNKQIFQVMSRSPATLVNSRRNFPTPSPQSSVDVMNSILFHLDQHCLEERGTAKTGHYNNILKLL